MRTADEKLLTLFDLNMAEFHREHARWLPPTCIEENEDSLRVACGSRFPAGPFNCAMKLGGSNGDAGSFLTDACRHFTALGRGFSVYARAHLDEPLLRACEDAGYPRLGNPPGMALLEPIAKPDPAPGVVIQTVCDETCARDFACVVASAYETVDMPAKVTAKLFSRPERWICDPHLRVEVLYDKDCPVAAAMLLWSHGIAGIYWVGTIPDARGRGHAERVVRSLCDRAFDYGTGAVILQASPYGEPIYRRLGFREITRYPWYMVSFERAKSGGGES